MPRHIFFSAGEPSGDQHAAGLMTRLKARSPGLRLSGFGGPDMAAAGQDSLFQLTDLAIMGFASAGRLLHKFWKLYRLAGEFLERERPDAVVLVDFPGFNWWIAKAARRAKVPVFYYCPPQLWAWAPWRIRKVHRLIDCVLSVLPFEARWYQERSVDVEFVGHPFFQEIAERPLDAQTMAALAASGSFRLGVLPGSRKQEVERNFPVMLDVVSELHRRHPNVRFPVACYRDWHRERCAQLIASRGESLPLDLYVGRTSEVIQSADCCLMVSGSVSLELLARGTPAVVQYRPGLLTYVIGHLFRTIDYISLPNLIVNRPVMPEFVFVRPQGSHVRRIIRILDRWVSDPMALAEVRQNMTSAADGVVEPGGLDRAAEVLLRRLDPRSAAGAVRRPRAA